MKKLNTSIYSLKAGMIKALFLYGLLMCLAIAATDLKLYPTGDDKYKANDNHKDMVQEGLYKQSSYSPVK
jgi:hypothetical protein